MMNYEIWTEQPTLGFYRRGFVPREDYTLAGLWTSGVYTGASGKRYHGLRGFDEFGHGVAHTYMFVQLNENNLVDFSPELYPELHVDQMEDYEYSESADGVHFVGENVQLHTRVGGFDWSDAKGRFDLHVEMLGQACTFWVPEQEGIPFPMLYRSHIGFATGTINGDPVEGFTLYDQSFSKPGVFYFQLPMIRKFEKQWSMWLGRYADGEVFAGYAWKGRGNTGFSAGHLIRRGVSHAFSDARVFTTYDKRGTVWKTRIELGTEVIELEQDSCSDWPAHTFGRVVSTSQGKKIEKSWNFIEWMPDNVEEMLERYFAGEVQPKDAKEAWIENECIVFPEHILRPR